MTRAMSTVLDAALACLLVTASVTVLGTTPGRPAPPADADRVGRAFLPTTVTTTADGRPVQASAGAHVAAAATTGVLPHESALTAALTALAPRAHVAAGPPDDPARVTFGRRPPAAASAVDAARFRLGGPPPVVVTVRTWSA